VERLRRTRCRRRSWGRCLRLSKCWVRVVQ
jgi:hypothetical protein